MTFGEKSKRTYNVWYIFLFNSQKNDSNIEILIIILDVKLLGRQKILIF